MKLISKESLKVNKIEKIETINESIINNSHIIEESVTENIVKVFLDNKNVQNIIIDLIINNVDFFNKIINAISSKIEFKIEKKDN